IQSRPGAPWRPTRADPETSGGVLETHRADPEPSGSALGTHIPGPDASGPGISRRLAGSGDTPGVRGVDPADGPGASRAGRGADEPGDRRRSLCLRAALLALARPDLPVPRPADRSAVDGRGGAPGDLAPRLPVPPRLRSEPAVPVVAVRDRR